MDKFAAAVAIFDTLTWQFYRSLV